MAKSLRPLALTVGDKGRVTLSEDVRRHLGVAEGDVLMLELNANGTVEMVPAALVPRDQVWFAHPEAQGRVAEAHGDIAAGRTARVGTAPALRSRLKKVRQASRVD